MMFRPRVVLVMFTSGSKGGVGKSTIVANLALLFDVPVAVVDLGVDGNLTTSLLHKVALQDGMSGFLDYLLLGRPYEVLESKISKMVYIVPAGTVRGIRVPVLASTCRDLLKARFEKFIADLHRRGVQVVLFDLPANSELLNIVHVLLTYYCDIVNVVCEPSISSIEALHRWWVMYSQVISRSSQVVNVVINKYLPALNSHLDYLSRYTINGVLVKLPFDSVTHILSTRCELAVLYREAHKFTKALTSFYKTLSNQIMKFLAAPRVRI